MQNVESYFILFAMTLSFISGKSNWLAKINFMARIGWIYISCG